MINEVHFNDTLVFTKNDKQYSNLIFSKMPIDRTGRLVIGISGCSGSHKSETAYTLRKKLGRVGIIAEIFSLDRCYKVEPEERNKARKKDGIIGIKELDIVHIYESIADYKENLIFPYAQVFIVEGLYACGLCGIDIKFHIDSNIDSTSEFRFDRKKEIINDFREYVLQKEYESVMSLKNKADYILTLDGEIICQSNQ